MIWPSVPLGELCDVRAGGTPSRSNNSYWGDGHKWLSIQEYSDFDIVTDTSEQITDEGLKNSSAKLFPKGAVIISIFATLGRVALLGEAMTTNQAIAGLVCGPKLDNRYLMYALKSKLSDIEKAAGGVAQKNINLSILRGLKIPLPPLETQKHIARVLEQADQLRKQAQQMASELNLLAQSLFLEMFGDPVMNPKGWQKVPMSHFVAEFEGGKSVAAAGDDSDQSQYRVLKISAVTWREFNPLESKPLPEEYQPEAEHFVRKGDLLFSRANTTELVGATSYVFDDYENLLLPDKLWRFVWKEGVGVSAMFIWNLFMTPGIRVELGKLSSGSGGSMKNISKGRLLPYEVIFPPHDVQKTFERKFMEIRNRERACREHVTEYEAMFNALMQRAFKGELTAPGSKAA